MFVRVSARLPVCIQICKSQRGARPQPAVSGQSGRDPDPSTGCLQMVGHSLTHLEKAPFGMRKVMEMVICKELGKNFTGLHCVLSDYILAYVHRKKKVLPAQLSPRLPHAPRHAHTCITYCWGPLYPLLSFSWGEIARACTCRGLKGSEFNRARGLRKNGERSTRKGTHRTGGRF